MNRTVPSRYVKCMPRESGVIRFQQKDQPIHQPFDEIVLKMTTFCQDDAMTSFRITTAGATIGRSEDSTIPIPADKALELQNHAEITWRNGVFYLEDGVNQCGTYIRLSPEENPQFHWPLRQNCRFRLGLSEFEVQIEHKKTSIHARTGKLHGTSYELDPTQPLSIGRSAKNSIHMGDAELSRYHAVIEYNPGDETFYLRDVGSTNGTFMKLTGPYQEPYRLVIGDEILVAKTCLCVNRFDYGICASMGARKTMEDMHSVIQDMQIDELSIFKGYGPAQSFFAVFDGHGGMEVSSYVSTHLHRAITQDMQLACRQLDPVSSTEEEIDQAIMQVLIQAFERTDKEILDTTDCPQPGSTATSIFIAGNRVFVANLGDSRTILSKGGQAVQLSQDQKPSCPDEAARIREMGGFIINGRIMGGLAVSRAFGDKDFKVHDPIIRETEQNGQEEVVCDGLKGPLVSSTPEVACFPIDPTQDEFVVLGSDGLYDVFTNQEIVDFILEKRVNMDIQRIAEALVENAITIQGSRDNVTAILIALTPPVSPT